MKKTDFRECEAVVLQAAEAIQEADEKRFQQILYPVTAEEWLVQTGETRLPKAADLKRVLLEVQEYGFAFPYEIESIVQMEEYEGKNWYEEMGATEILAVEAAVYWASSAGRNTCHGWPVPFQCLRIDGQWYLNPFWVREYMK